MLKIYCLSLCCNIFHIFIAGQIELYTHIPVMRRLVDTLHSWDFRIGGVFLLDAQFLVESSKFFSGILSALSAMVQLEIPHINVLSKMDLLSKESMKTIERYDTFSYYLFAL